MFDCFCKFILHLLQFFFFLFFDGLHRHCLRFICLFLAGKASFELGGGTHAQNLAVLLVFFFALVRSQRRESVIVREDRTTRLLDIPTLHYTRLARRFFRCSRILLFFQGRRFRLRNGGNWGWTRTFKIPRMTVEAVTTFGTAFGSSKELARLVQNIDSDNTLFVHIDNVVALN